MMTTYGADLDIQLRSTRARGIVLGEVHFLVGLPIGVGTELARVDIVEVEDDDTYELELEYTPSTYFAIAGGAKVLSVLDGINETVSGILEFFSAEPTLLHGTHPALQTGEERQVVALQSLRERMRKLSDALSGMDTSPGFVAPDPYRGLELYMDDLLRVWDEELAVDVADDEIGAGVALVRDAKDRLESDGIARHDVERLPAVERRATFAALVADLASAVARLMKTLDRRLPG